MGRGAGGLGGGSIPFRPERPLIFLLRGQRGGAPTSWCWVRSLLILRNLGSPHRIFRHLVNTKSSDCRRNPDCGEDRPRVTDHGLNYLEHNLYRALDATKILDHPPMAQGAYATIPPRTLVIFTMVGFDRPR